MTERATSISAILSKNQNKSHKGLSFKKIIIFNNDGKVAYE